MYRNIPREAASNLIGLIRQSLHVRHGDDYHPPFLEGEQASNEPELAVPGGLPGRHLLAEFLEARALDAPQLIEMALRRAITDARATLLNLHMHVFTSSGGVTATASLAESHITVHTWPERGYAAIDIFMCGGCNPRRCLPGLTAILAPRRVLLRELVRDAEGCVNAKLMTAM